MIIIIKILLILIFVIKAPLIWAYDIEWSALDIDPVVKVYEGKVAGEDLVAFKGSDIFNYSMTDVISVLADIEHSDQWISSMKKAQTIENISATERIDYNHQALPWPFKDRDFVFRITTSVSAEGKQVLFQLKSEEHPNMPVQEKIIRGWLMQSYLQLNALENGDKTRLEIMMLADPKGFIPKWLVNLINRYWAVNTIHSLQKYMNDRATKRDTIQANAEI